MPAFMSNKWFQLALALVAGIILERKLGIVAKVGLGTTLTPAA